MPWNRPTIDRADQRNRPIVEIKEGSHPRLPLERQLPKLALVDAQAVFDLVGPEAPELGRKLVHPEARAPSPQAQRSRAVPGAAVEVDEVRLEAEVGADPQSGVVDRQLADPFDRADGLGDELVKLVEGGSARHASGQEPVAGLLELPSGDTVLVGMSSCLAVDVDLGQRCS